MKPKFKNKRFAVIGGDYRSIAAANYLSGLGFCVYVFAFDKKYRFEPDIIRAETLSEAVSTADCILLPLPCSSDKERLNTPLYDKTVLLDDLFSILHAEQIIFAGKTDEALRDRLKKSGLLCHDYAEREDFAVLNAVPTAEGAIEIALHELPVTMSGVQCLVTGFGRIAKVLSHRLLALGARVTVSARRSSDRTWCKVYGYTPLDIKALPESAGAFQVVFNTVPNLILDREFLSRLSANSLIIDLASKPGGADEKFG